MFLHACNYRWLAKSCRPLSMPENDKAFRVWVKQITYGRYQPPTEATVHSELCKLHAETEIVVRQKISTYQVCLLSFYICNTVMSHVLLYPLLSCYYVILHVHLIRCLPCSKGGKAYGQHLCRHLGRGRQELTCSDGSPD